MGGGGTATSGSASPSAAFRADRWRVHARVWEIGGIPRLLGLGGEAKGSLSSVLKLRFVQRGSGSGAGDEVPVAQDSDKPVRWTSESLLIPKMASTFSFTSDDGAMPSILSTYGVFFFKNNLFIY